MLGEPASALDASLVKAFCTLQSLLDALLEARGAATATGGVGAVCEEGFDRGFGGASQPGVTGDSNGLIGPR